MLDQLRPGDTVVVWRLDRLGRSLRNLIALVEHLAEREVGFRSLTESIDTSTPGGKSIFNIFASLAEFERSLIRERTVAGLAAARARGRKGGRPPAMTPQQVKLARTLYDAREHSVAAIAGMAIYEEPRMCNRNRLLLTRWNSPGAEADAA
jgi:DNA invertase Pin-like site-specific DNA recombinase